MTNRTKPGRLWVRLAMLHKVLQMAAWWETAMPVLHMLMRGWELYGVDIQQRQVAVWGHAPTKNCLEGCWGWH
jgi:hypothetical protein